MFPALVAAAAAFAVVACGGGPGAWVSQAALPEAPDGAFELEPEPSERPVFVPAGHRVEEGVLTLLIGNTARERQSRLVGISAEGAEEGSALLISDFVSVLGDDTVSIPVTQPVPPGATRLVMHVYRPSDDSAGNYEVAYSWSASMRDVLDIPTEPWPSDVKQRATPCPQFRRTLPPEVDEAFQAPAGCVVPQIVPVAHALEEGSFHVTMKNVLDRPLEKLVQVMAFRPSQPTLYVSNETHTLNPGESVDIAGDTPVPPDTASISVYVFSLKPDGYPREVDYIWTLPGPACGFEQEHEKVGRDPDFTTGGGCNPPLVPVGHTFDGESVAVSMANVAWETLKKYVIFYVRGPEGPLPVLSDAFDFPAGETVDLRSEVPLPPWTTGVSVYVYAMYSGGPGLVEYVWSLHGSPCGYVSGFAAAVPDKAFAVSEGCPAPALVPVRYEVDGQRISISFESIADAPLRKFVVFYVSVPDRVPEQILSGGFEFFPGEPTELVSEEPVPEDATGVHVYVYEMKFDGYPGDVDYIWTVELGAVGPP